jgi:hypothetical protein
MPLNARRFAPKSRDESIIASFSDRQTTAVVDGLVTASASHDIFISMTADDNTRAFSQAVPSPHAPGHRLRLPQPA